jgi:exonuclease III
MSTDSLSSEHAAEAGALAQGGRAGRGLAGRAPVAVCGSGAAAGARRRSSSQESVAKAVAPRALASRRRSALRAGAAGAVGDEAEVEAEDDVAEMAQMAAEAEAEAEAAGEGKEEAKLDASAQSQALRSPCAAGAVVAKQSKPRVNSTTGHGRRPAAGASLSCRPRAWLAHAVSPLAVGVVASFLAPSHVQNVSEAAVSLPLPGAMSHMGAMSQQEAEASETGAEADDELARDPSSHEEDPQVSVPHASRGGDAPLSFSNLFDASPAGSGGAHPVARTMLARRAPLRAWRKEAARPHGHVARLCVWRMPQAYSTAALSAHLRRALGQRLSPSLLKLARVVQRVDGATRADVFVPARLLRTVLQRLRRNTHWIVREHKSWRVRNTSAARCSPVVAAGAVAEEADAWVPVADDNERDVAETEEVAAGADAPLSPARTRRLRVATWNVRSLAAERDDVVAFAGREELSLFALQETRLSGRSYPLAVRGMNVFESRVSSLPGSSSTALGIALCVSASLPAVAVLPVGEHHLWVRVVSLLPDRPVFVCCVYAKKGTDVIRTVGLEAAQRVLSGAEVLILGDFNCAASVAVRRLARAGFGGSAVRVCGAPGTFHGRGRWSSAIDHIVCSPELARTFTRAVVRRSEDRSDHWPLVASLVVPSANGGGAEGEAEAAAQKGGSFFAAPAAVARRLQRSEVALSSLLHDNRFRVLAEMTEAMQTSEEEIEACALQTRLEFPVALRGALESAVSLLQQQQPEGDARSESVPCVDAAVARYPKRTDGRRRARIRRANAAVGFRLSRRARAAVASRKAAFCLVQKAPAHLVEERWSQYAECRDRAAAVLREERDARVAASVQYRVRMLQRGAGQGRAYWQRLSALRMSPEGDIAAADAGVVSAPRSGRQAGAVGGSFAVPTAAGVPFPIVDESSGALVHQAGDAAKVWRNHFERLLGDVAAAPVEAVAAENVNVAAADAAGSEDGRVRVADDDDEKDQPSSQQLRHEANATAKRVFRFNVAADHPALQAMSDMWREAPLTSPDGSSLDRRFDAREVAESLRLLKAHKACGTDGLAVEVLQLADPGDETLKTNGPYTVFFVALMDACNAWWTLPDPEAHEAVLADRVAMEAWNTVRLVPVPKKGGDLTRCDSYRGIGIQSALGRLTSMLALRRLAPAVEAAGLLGLDQAGFRSREEAVAQVATLLEVCGRRRQSQAATYLLFVDFAKAYDSVPHALLLAKLAAMGIQGAPLCFIARSLDLYRAAPPSVAGAESRGADAAAASGNDGGDAHAFEPFAVRRGVIQGSPLSPLLFNLFIADLLRNVRGVSVSGVTDVDPSTRISNLKYADDVVAFARSESGLERRVRQVAQWCANNGMRLGVDKCGAMVVGTSVHDTAQRHAELAALAARGGLSVPVDAASVSAASAVGGAPSIPVVEQYRYLGVLVNNLLDRCAMARARAVAARSVLGQLTPVLCDKRIPRYERVLMAKAFVVPVVLYGAELWAGSREVVQPLELVLNRVWTLVLGVPRTASRFTARREAPCLSAAAASMVATARAFTKWESLSTWVKVLVRMPPRPSRRGTRSVLQLAARALNRCDRAIVSGALRGDGSVASAKRLAAAAAERAEARADKTMAGLHWRRYDLGATVGEARRLAIAGVRDVVSGGFVVHQVGRMRVGTFSTCQRLARAGVLLDAERWRRSCPFCGEAVPEDLAHFVVECAAWAGARNTFLVPVLRQRPAVLRWLGQPQRRLDVLHYLLGGKVGPYAARSLVRGSSGSKRGVREQSRVPVAEVGAIVADVACEAAVPVRRVSAAVERQKQLAASGLNWLAGLGRFLRAVWSDRVARGPPRSRSRQFAGGMAGLVAPGQAPAG